MNLPHHLYQQYPIRPYHTGYDIARTALVARRIGYRTYTVHIYRITDPYGATIAGTSRPCSSYRYLTQDPTGKYRDAGTTEDSAQRAALCLIARLRRADVAAIKAGESPRYGTP